VNKLFCVLIGLRDRVVGAARFLVLGRASPGLLRLDSETFEGRIYYYPLKSFSLDEVGPRNYRQLWLRGGFLRSYLAHTHAASVEWRRGFVRTFLGRNLPQLGMTMHSRTLNRFWYMLIHCHGEVWKTLKFARSFGVASQIRPCVTT
jgi:hypothetical protein